MTDVVIAIVPNKYGLWLFLQRRKGPEDGIIWSFPGGKVEPNETEQLALIREVREETGLSVIPERRLGENAISPNLRLIYWSCNISGGQLASENTGATLNVGFYSFSEIQDLIHPRKVHPVVSGFVHSRPREQTIGLDQIDPQMDIHPK